MDTSPRSAEVVVVRRATAARALRCARRAVSILVMACSTFGCGLEAAPKGSGEAAAPFIEHGGSWLDPVRAIEVARDRSFEAIEEDQAPIEEVAQPAPDPEASAPSEAASPPQENNGGNNTQGERPSAGPSVPPPARQFAFMSIDQRLAILRNDLDAFDNPSDRERLRYIDFTHLANAGLNDEELEPYRQAVSFLVNSLSTGNAVVVPLAIDDDRLLYRLDLRDYGWNAGTWEAIVDDYPYAVRYDEDSRVLPFDGRTADEIRDDTGTLVPYIHADWFLAHASSAPLYYDVLGIPGNVLALADDLGVDVLQDVRDQQIARAGLNSSAVALNNRVVERHEMPGSSGALWLTYDFVNSVDARNVYAHPVDFRQDQSEGVFTLPNGLQGYFIADGNFQRRDTSSTAIVTDPQRRDRAVKAGISCMGGCHLDQGLAAVTDEVRDYVVLSAPDGRTIDQTLAVYATRAELAQLLAEDQARYRAALAQTGYQLKGGNGLNELVHTHEDSLDLEAVAAVFGIKPIILARALDSSPQVFPPEILPLRDPGAVIHRETLDAVAAGVIEGLGMGSQIQP